MFTGRRWFGVASASLVVLAAACSGLIPPLTPTVSPVGAPLAVSGESPFSSCPHKGQISFGSEVEPSLAIDPADPNRLVMAWQQDRNFQGGALGLLTAWSDDGGRSWQTTMPPVTSCTGGPYDLASDPALAMGPDRAYLAGIGIEVVGSGAQLTLDDEVVVLTSGDRGRTWGRPVVVATSPDPLVNFDKETIVADPRIPGRAYVLWVQYTSAAEGRAAKTNQTFISRTTDGGMTWSSSVLAYDGGTETQFHQLVAMPDGSLLDAFIQAPTLSGRPPLSATLATIRSTDGGLTWSAPTIAATVMFTAVVDPTGKDQIRGTGQGILAAAAPDGAVYVCWAEQHLQGDSFLAVVRSQDDGKTWSAPTRVVSTSSGQPFVPQVAVAGDWRVGVSWYQVTRRGTEDQLDTEAWLAWSADRGQSWQSLRLGGPFDLHTAKLTAGGDFLGDYEGLVGLPAGFAAAYAMAGPISHAGSTDVFFSGVKLGP